MTSLLLSTLHTRQFSRRLWSPFTLFLCLLALIGCDTPTPRLDSSPVVPVDITPTPTLLPVQARNAIFEEVWRTVDREYYSLDHGKGAFWLKLHSEYKHRATQAGNVDEFYDAIKEMVEQLKDDHSGYLTPWEAREEDAYRSGSTDYAGIGILGQADGDFLFISYVFPGSPAEKAGLQRRDRILAVDGQPLEDAETASNSLRGLVGTPVTVTVRSPGQPPRDMTIVRQHITGGENPTLTTVGSEPTIGYLVIPSFSMQDMDRRVEQALLDFTNRLANEGTTLKGLVIDLRGNGGGYGTVTHGILGQFMEGNIGRTNGKGNYSDAYDSPVRTVVRGLLFDRLRYTPLVVLIDRHTESNGEVFAAALQSKGRAKVVGTRSAGNTENVTDFNFSDGSRLWLATAYFMLWDGTNLEGKGVTPDVMMGVDWASFAEKEDPHILEAVRIIKEGGAGELP
jgi:carboxyl-terminal processing protease